MLLTSLLKDFELAEQIFDRSYEYPSIQLYSDKDNLRLLAEVPGVNEKDLDISVTEDVIGISGKVEKTQKEGESFKSIRSERWSGSFSRKVELPVEVESGQAKAALENGVLEITLPIKEKVKPKSIAINVK